jgi:hypothetical protein
MLAVSCRRTSVGLRLDVEPGEHERRPVAEAAERVDRHLELRWWRLAPDAVDPDPVGSLLGEPDRVEAGGDVGVEVPGAAELVEQLGRDRADADAPAGAGVLRDDAGPVTCELRDREADVLEVRDLLEERVVAAGRLRAALDHVPGDDRAGQRVPVVALPAEAPDPRADHQARVGDPAGDHHVGVGVERTGDTEPAEVGVRGQWGGAARPEASPVARFASG